MSANTLRSTLGLAAIGTVWIICQLLDVNLPTMQSYNLALGWKDKCRMCRWALEYIRLLFG